MKYKEIIKLVGLLEANEIPYKINEKHNGYQVLVYVAGDYISAIQHDGSFQNDKGIEIMGGQTKVESKNDNVTYPLSAKEVFERIKYCLDNNTLQFKKEKDEEEYGLYWNLELIEYIERIKPQTYYLDNVLELLKENAEHLKKAFMEDDLDVGE